MYDQHKDVNLSFIHYYLFIIYGALHQQLGKNKKQNKKIPKKTNGDLMLLKSIYSILFLSLPLTSFNFRFSPAA